MKAHPARTLGLNARKRERVRCSSLVDWPVYPRLRHTMRASNAAQFLAEFVMTDDMTKLAADASGRIQEGTLRAVRRR